MEDRFDLHARSLIVRLLLDRTGQTLSDDRKYRIDRAIESVLAKRGITRSADLVALLTQPDSAAVEQELIEALLNNETYFFRDRHVFKLLADRVLPEIAKSRAASRELSIWSAGCSTGQEPLSLAMLLLEQGSIWRGWRIRIVATDISETAIAKAREATYSQFDIQRGLAVSQMLSHFDETPQGWRAKQELRDMIRYETGNLIADQAADRTYDLILCRNVMLYLGEEARLRAWNRLAKSMNSHSHLVLGGGETIIGSPQLFEPSLDEGGAFRLIRSAAAKAAAA